MKARLAVAAGLLALYAATDCAAELRWTVSSHRSGRQYDDARPRASISASISYSSGGERLVGAVASFYHALQPHGTWQRLHSLGWVWTPFVADRDSDWRPYRDGGRWTHSGGNRRWRSSYVWGWAPFHYGRWYLSDFHGWVWVPGLEWSDAWVVWTDASGYRGWAPVPPEHVNTRSSIMLGSEHFVFVLSQHVFGYSISRVAVSRQRVPWIYSRSRHAGYHDARHHKRVVTPHQSNHYTTYQPPTVVRPPRSRRTARVYTVRNSPTPTRTPRPVVSPVKRHRGGGVVTSRAGTTPATTSYSASSKTSTRKVTSSGGRASRVAGAARRFVRR